jgi:hypothetical protein
MQALSVHAIREPTAVAAFAAAAAVAFWILLRPWLSCVCQCRASYWLLSQEISNIQKLDRVMMQ